MMTPEQLRAIEERCSKATSEPWYVFEQDAVQYTRRFVMHKESVTLAQMNTPCLMYSNMEADAEFIAHARTDLPALVQEVKRLRGERDHYEKQVTAAITERDSVEEWADKLAEASGEVGEHSSHNNPWLNGLENIEKLRADNARLREVLPKLDLEMSGLLGFASSLGSAETFKDATGKPCAAVPLGWIDSLNGYAKDVTAALEKARAALATEKATDEARDSQPD